MLSKQQLESSVVDFVEAFNTQHLDTVLSKFADNAVYRSVDGLEHCGKKAIKKALAAQFLGNFGELIFDLQSMYIDTTQQTVVLLWRCQHNLYPKMKPSMLGTITRTGLGMFWGKKFYWRGLDVLTFDATGSVCQKETFAQTKLPYFIR